MTLWEIVLTLALSWGFVLWGVLLCHGRGTWLLAGWNTMPREKRASYHEKALLKLYGRCVVLCGAGVFLLLSGSFSEQDVLLCAGLALIALRVLASIAVPVLNPKKYRK